MASSRASCCLPSVKKQKHDFNFTFRSMYNKTIIILSFCDIQNNRGLGKDYQPQPSASPQPQPCLFPPPPAPPFIGWLSKAEQKMKDDPDIGTNYETVNQQLEEHKVKTTSSNDGNLK